MEVGCALCPHFSPCMVPKRLWVPSSLPRLPQQTHLARRQRWQWPWGSTAVPPPQGHYLLQEQRGRQLIHLMVGSWLCRGFWGVLPAPPQQLTLGWRGLGWPCMPGAVSAEGCCRSRWELAPCPVRAVCVCAGMSCLTCSCPSGSWATSLLGNH